MNPNMKRGNPTQVLNRVLRYMLRYYKFGFNYLILKNH